MNWQQKQRKRRKVKMRNKILHRDCFAPVAIGTRNDELSCNDWPKPRRGNLLVVNKVRHFLSPVRAVLLNYHNVIPTGFTTRSFYALSTILSSLRNLPMKQNKLIRSQGIRELFILLRFKGNLLKERATAFYFNIRYSIFDILKSNAIVSYPFRVLKRNSVALQFLIINS